MYDEDSDDEDGDDEDGDDEEGDDEDDVVRMIRVHRKD